MDFYEISLDPQPVFTHAGVARGLPGYVHPRRQALDIPEVFIIERGTLHIEGDGRRETATRGAVVFHPAGTQQVGWRPSPHGVTFAWVHFMADIAGRDLADGEHGRIHEDMHHGQQAAGAITRSIVIPRISRPVHFPEILDTGYRLAERSPRLAAERAALVTLLLGRLSVSWFGEQGAAGSDPADAIVAKVKYWVEKHLSRNAGVSDIAGRVGLNPDYLNRVFRRRTGVPLSVYLRLRKLERARHLLSTGMSVKQAAAQTGFEDPAYFSRAFKAHVGMAPSVYARSESDYRRN